MFYSSFFIVDGGFALKLSILSSWTAGGMGFKHKGCISLNVWGKH